MLTKLSSGKTPAAVELCFLNEIKDLELYGTELFPVLVRQLKRTLFDPPKLVLLKLIINSVYLFFFYIFLIY